MFGLGTTELIIISVIILFIFGAKRLPGIGKTLGETVREVKNIKKGMGSKEKAEKVQDDKETTEDKDSPSSF
jgi:sec-independent protein translocase protein TatA